MRRTMAILAVATASLVGPLAGAGHAAGYYRPLPNFRVTPNPNFRVAPAPNFR